VSFRRLRFLILIAIAELGCQKKAEGPRPRYAVVRFENLSGDPSLDWTGRAASETLSVSLAGALNGPMLASWALSRLAQPLGQRPASAPGISTERQEALLAGATRLISGYVETRGGQLRIAATEEDLSTGKSLLTVSAETPAAPIGMPAGIIDALNKIAREFSPNPKPPPTSNPSALRLYSIALDSPVAVSADDLEQATRLDPAFGAAWVALTNLKLAQRDRSAAEEVSKQARLQKIDVLSQARLDLEAAELENNIPARIEALRKVSSLSPGDTILIRTLAEAETAAGDFQAAAAEWRRLTVALPNDPSSWNTLGYTLSYAGDYNGAMAALQQYARMRPKDANAWDSIGDLNYWFRKFKEAADSYMQARSVQPDFEQYGDLYKAAWAKFHAGDKPGADALFSQFVAEREKTASGLMPLTAADWLYRTGRKREAFDSLRKTVAGTTSETLRGNGFSQLAIWDLIGSDREQASRDAAAMGPKLSDAPMLIIRFAAMPSASASEWEQRADRIIPPSVGPLRGLALGYALVLDGKRDAALAVWEQIVKSSSATDFFPRAMYTRLKGKALEHPLLPEPANLNQFLAVLDSL
jgi:tetratricopeptide (TPR) repeat protein